MIDQQQQTLSDAFLVCPELGAAPEVDRPEIGTLTAAHLARLIRVHERGVPTPALSDLLGANQSDRLIDATIVQKYLCNDARVDHHHIVSAPDKKASEALRCPSVPEYTLRSSWTVFWGWPRRKDNP